MEINNNNSDDEVVYHDDDGNIYRERTSTAL